MYLTFMLVLSCQAFALDTWLGFKPLAQLPEFTFSEKTVFAIAYPEGAPVEVIDPNSKKATDYPNDITGWIKSLQLIVCQRNQMRLCPILPDTHAGTAFLVRDGHTIGTVLHNLQTWLFYAKKFNPELNLTKITPPIILFNFKRETVFEPMTGKQDLKITLINPSADVFSKPFREFRTQAERLAITMSEYVELTSDQPLGETGIPVGKIDSSQKFFMLGYPHKTNFYAKNGGTDAPGEELVVSTGDLFGFDPKYPIAIASTLAGAPGSSGSPVLNERHEVVAIAVAGDSNCVQENNDCRIKDGKLDPGIGLVRLDNLDLMRATWNSTSLK